jgi:CBS domain-containing protein
MLVKSILKEKGPGVVAVGPDMRVIDALQVLADKRIGAVLVWDNDQKIMGILSERDVVRALPVKGAGILDIPVSELMTRTVVTCRPEDTVDRLMALMTDNRIRHVPVVESGKLMGIVSIGDVVKNKIAEAEMEAQALKQYIATG